MSKKLVIFDLDGTLLDTSEDLKNSMNKMLESYGYPRITADDAKRFIGNGARMFVLRSLPDYAKDKVDEAMAKYNDFYNNSGSPCTHLYAGMGEVLEFCNKAGLKTAIVSNKPQASTDAVYEEYLSSYPFDYVYGRREGFGHKPDKECGEYVLNALGCDKNDTIVVGDGETDVKFAINLGTKCISVLWGYRPKEVLRKEGADTFVETPKELLEEIKKFAEK